MDYSLTDWIRSKRIDSFHKLRLLLLFHKHPHMKATCQEFAEQLYLADTVLLTGIIKDLMDAGLIGMADNCYTLHDHSDIRSSLHSLAQAFDDPIERQILLDHVTRNPSIV